ncbi:hypothetical protein [Streptomyces sp. CBMA29]|uniref:hypothetical protein n=1 Tax=Streptomyces sp. CBMA29 TaxID=1896314 RepID=UPI001662083A|nr:hypothetical protein [Streptomyces sp. CBMA29]MBD0734093.1 hypothetical protein [Streptomyces sp. CBMA29]
MAADLGGRVTPGSGNQWHTKNDVIAPGWSVECKTTGAKSFSLKADDLRTAERNALIDGREVLFVVDMQGRSWAVLPYHTFLALLPDPEA